MFERSEFCSLLRAQWMLYDMLWCVDMVFEFEEALIWRVSLN